LPTGFTHFRRVASIIRVAGVIDGYYQKGDYFYRDVPTREVSAGWTLAANTSIFPVLTKVPTGIIGWVIGDILSSGATQGGLTMNSPLTGDNVSDSFGPYHEANYQNSGYLIMFDTLGRVRVKSQNAMSAAFLTVFGWIDTRGKEN
jgi:hypothetical protein